MPDILTERQRTVTDIYKNKVHETTQPIRLLKQFLNGSSSILYYLTVEGERGKARRRIPVTTTKMRKILAILEEG